MIEKRERKINPVRAPEGSENVSEPSEPLPEATKPAKTLTLEISLPIYPCSNPDFDPLDSITRNGFSEILSSNLNDDE